MLGRMGIIELVVIAAVVLFIVGPKRLPGVARSAAKGFGEYQKVTKELKDTLNVTDVFKGKK